MTDNSKIIITHNIDLYLEDFIPTLPIYNYRIIKNEEDNKSNFKIEHARQVIKEAYIASSEPKYIILCGTKYEVEAQNKLLKILEEPPKNIIFIIITTAKANLLHTIISRLPHKYIKNKLSNKYINYDVFSKDLKDIYIFIKEHQRISKNEAQTMIESFLYEAWNKKYKLKTQDLDLFSKSFKLLNLNSKPINIITTVILNILDIKQRG
jgi:DNA polymerase-3 subunit delta'